MAETFLQFLEGKVRTFKKERQKKEIEWSQLRSSTERELRALKLDPSKIKVTYFGPRDTRVMRAERIKVGDQYRFWKDLLIRFQKDRAWTKLKRKESRPSAGA